LASKAHTPAGKAIEHPGWRVILKGRLSTNGQTKTYDLNYLYTLQQHVPGSAWSVSILVMESFHVECYVFAQDLPHVWGRYKEWERELNRKEEELKRLSNEHLLYEGRCQGMGAKGARDAGHFERDRRSSDHHNQNAGAHQDL
jgi:hypothetical protein